MIAYLDTQAAIRLSDGRGRIGRDAARIIDKANLLCSPIVLVEMEYLFEIGRLRLSAKDILRKLEHELEVRLCDLPFSKVAEASLNEKWTRDPFDRIIVAQAKANGLAWLISTDEQIAEHYQRTVW